ncbi:hypothetical protein GF1_02540 [Desulfolithobacter dissulfuricans]|uniref:Cyclic nucleotide-binding domain-containing protein n=1 Tax=Desulfolithobacter dissulfuricans TaxID=2795293 RepID=A0A915TY24_9BACT|nr:DUF4388 domain-containing protein [Desulfolithobacter dissulfuricans]BCO07878.1 hypothetical protein GF1_02540 [Desulfolithobacter dissulfuricans]
MDFRNAIFVVTEEQGCPIYNVGEELKVEDNGLRVPEAKPVCLILVQEIIKATAEKRAFEHFSPGQGVQRSKFDCGGCSGLIRFEYKKEKEFATLQMKLLAAAEQRQRMRHLEEFFDLLRCLDIFEPLNDDDLTDLAALLKLREFPPGKVILQEGEPGTHLYIVLSGKVVVVGKDNLVLSELGAGEIFGEMSLLSGEPVTTSVHSREHTKLATLSSKDFKHVLNKFPVLQVFFYRMLVDRAQANTMRAGKIVSGMTGDLAEIAAVDLFQLINSSQKTGRVEMLLEDGEAVVLFNEGELVHARYRNQTGKEALFALLGKNRGRFSYTSGLAEEQKQLPVLGGFMGLIMEGMRRIDEQRERNGQQAGR